MSNFELNGNLRPATTYFPEPQHTISEAKPFISKMVTPADLLFFGCHSLQFRLDIPSDMGIYRPGESLVFEISTLSFEQTGMTFDHTGNITAPFGIIHPKLEWAVRGPN